MSFLFSSGSTMPVFLLISIFGCWSLTAISATTAMQNDKKIVTAPLYYNIGAQQDYPNFYVDLQCGTPPQTQGLVVSTGAIETMLPCQGESATEDDSFQESESLTLQPVTCGEEGGGTKDVCNEMMGVTDGSTRGRYQCINAKCHTRVRYEDGSGWGATLAQDYCSLASGTTVTDREENSSPDPFVSDGATIQFACQTSAVGSFAREEKGTLSLSNGPMSFWKQIYQAQKLSRPQFSLCLAEPPRDTVPGSTSSVPAGFLTVGGIESFLGAPSTRTSTTVTSPAMQYAQLTSDTHGNFNVHLRKVHLQHEERVVPLDISSDRLVREVVTVESSYPHSHFSVNLGQPFRLAWFDLTGQNWEHPTVRYTLQEQIQDLPTLWLQLEGLSSQGTIAEPHQDLPWVDPDFPHDVLIAVPPHRYMKYDDQQGIFVPRFHFETKPLQDSSILGMDALMGYSVLFDIDSHRIGWAQSSCDSLLLAKPAAKSGQTLSSSQRPYPSSADEARHGTLRHLAALFMFSCLVLAFYVVIGRKVGNDKVRGLESGNRHLSYEDYATLEVELAETGSGRIDTYEQSSLS